MSERGVFAIDRGIFDDPDFPDEQFSEREALIWLIGQAAWRPTKVRVGSALVALARGQCAFSTRFMAAKWKWSEARVRRWLKRLIKLKIIDAAADAHATHITLRKYDRFQRVSLPGDAHGDAEATHLRRTSDALATQQRRKEEDIEDIKDIEDRDTSLRSVSLTRGFPPNAFGLWYANYPHKVGRAAAEKAFEKVRLSGKVEFSDLVDGLRRYRASKPANREWCNPATWLNQARWADQPAPVAEPLAQAGLNGRESKSSNGALSLLNRIKGASDVSRTSNGYDHAGPVIEHQGDGGSRGEVCEQAGGSAWGLPAQAVVEFPRTRWAGT